MTRLFALLLVILALASPAQSGPIADFNSAYGRVQTSYRFAVLGVAGRDPAKATEAMQRFARKWTGFRASYGTTPPPHLAEDQGWTGTISQVDQALASAQMSALSGDLAETRRAMRSIRAILTQMHRRNGIVTDADRIESYRTRLGQILRLDLSGPDAAGVMREHAAVLTHLAADLAQAPLPARLDPAKNAQMIDALTASAQALLTAARQGDPAAILAARKGLMKPYSQLLLLRG